MSSLSDVLITPEAPGYAASKAGLSAYLIALGAVVRRHGVRSLRLRRGARDGGRRGGLYFDLAEARMYAVADGVRGPVSAP